MIRIFFIIFFLSILILFIAAAVKILISQKGFTWRSVLNYLASACLIIGAVGFCGSMLSLANFPRLPHSFEWPIGSTDSALICRDGKIVVPHTPSGRVQIYDQSLKFIRGWHVDAGLGSFKLFPANEHGFYIYAGRNHMKYHYDLDGNLLLSQKYTGGYPKGGSAATVSIPTPFYLQVFTHPVRAVLAAMFGMFLLFITGGKLKKYP